MAHDPLCPFRRHQPGSGGTGTVALIPEQPAIPCSCDLIAKVRADERNRVFTHLDALADRDHTDGCPSLTCTGCGT